MASTWEFFSEELNCSGVDSGKDACWPLAVNITIPVVCCVIFFLLVILMLVFPPKIPAQDRTMVEDYNRLTKEIADLKNSGRPLEMTAVNSTAHLVESA